MAVRERVARLVRLDPRIDDALARSAKANLRSVTAEINAILRRDLAARRLLSDGEEVVAEAEGCED